MEILLIDIVLILKKLYSIWTQISTIGVAHPNHVGIELKVKLSNQIAITVCALMVVMALFYHPIPIVFFGYLSAPIGYGIILKLNQIGHFRVARIVFIGIAVIGTVIIASFTADSHMFSSKLALISTMVLPVLLFGIDEVLGMILGILFILVSFILMDSIVAYIPAAEEAKGLNLEGPLYVTINAIVSVVMLSMVYVYLQLIIKENQRELYQQNIALQAQKEQIELLNRDLAKRIEDALGDLSITNSALNHNIQKIQQFVFHNSHILRQPICNVLGLLEMLKGTSGEEFEAILASIQIEVDVLERLTKESDEILKVK